MNLLRFARTVCFLCGQRKQNTLEDLQSFLAPGLVLWPMRSSDLPALAAMIEARYATMRRQRDEAWQMVCRGIDRGTTR